MILPRPGRWSSAHGQWLSWWRIHWHGRPTMFCMVVPRYATVYGKKLSWWLPEPKEEEA